MEYSSSILVLIIFIIFYFVHRNRYGWTNSEFSKAYRNKQFIINNNLKSFKKIRFKLTFYNVFIILLFIFLIDFEIMSSIFMYDNNLTIWLDDNFTYLDYSSNVWKIKDIIDNKVVFEFNTIWLVNIIQLIFSIIFSLFIFLYLRMSNMNKYKDEIWYLNYEQESKMYKFNKISYKKLSILFLILIILHFIFQYCNLFMQLEKPNIDGYIDYDDNLFNLLKINEKINYDEIWVNSSMSWVQILFLVLSCVSLLLIVILIYLHSNYNWLIFDNNFYKIYLENSKNK